ncbi:membrane-associated transporter protein [Onthophagus taurus]|uniref:membrane-associated transporter protein n=1 Tax=Onthophagus taurus TaxID=166361 RepID=UPI000C201A7C|nr:proton-associated sugar transporter A [Onthophagus taurus]
MAEKLYEYEGCLGRFHRFKDEFKEKWQEFQQDGGFNVKERLKRKNQESEDQNEDYSHIYRSKSRKELIRISAAVMGIEFSYAAETAFVSPTLLKIGVEHKHMTLVWALSPLIGFFVTPILGSLSDRCSLKLGRRRPFIIAMSIGVLLGLLLVPNGENMGYSFGDSKPPDIEIIQKNTILSHRTSASSNSFNQTLNNAYVYNNSHPWGIFFTVLGTVLLDFDADACQSPSRAYLLDVTIPGDHARGLSTFTIMAGLGGFFGYALGGINWDATKLGILLGGHVKAVFTLITGIFLVCVAYTVTSFKEIPLNLLEFYDEMQEDVQKFKTDNELGESIEFQELQVQNTYGTLQEEPNQNDRRKSSLAPPPGASFIIYLRSIFIMPNSLKILCVTNLFCWMAHVCYSLYFTDFVGEAVFKGDPMAFPGSSKRILYEEGVRFGCWGMSMYSLSCACYSSIIEKLINRFGAKKVYVCGLLFYSTGMLLMALTQHKISVILFSWTAGVMYSTLFTMPYLLIAHYHHKGVFELSSEGNEKVLNQIRGLGTDVAIVSSMVFLAQFILSICMGTIVNISGTTTAVVSVASVLALCGAISATQIMYLEL